MATVVVFLLEFLRGTRGNSRQQLLEELDDAPADRESASLDQDRRKNAFKKLFAPTRLQQSTSAPRHKPPSMEFLARRVQSTVQISSDSSCGLQTCTRTASSVNILPTISNSSQSDIPIDKSPLNTPLPSRLYHTGSSPNIRTTATSSKQSNMSTPKAQYSTMNAGHTPPHWNQQLVPFSAVVNQPHYDRNISCTLGVIQIVCGLIVIACQAALTVLHSDARFSGSGFWCGAVFIVAGSLGCLAAKHRSDFMIGAYLVVSIIALVLSASIFASSAVALKPDEKHMSNPAITVQHGHPKFNWYTTLGVHILIMVTSLVEVIVLVYGCVLTSQAMRYGNKVRVAARSSHQGSKKSVRSKQSISSCRSSSSRRSHSPRRSRSPRSHKRDKAGSMHHQLQQQLQQQLPYTIPIPSGTFLFPPPPQMASLSPHSQEYQQQQQQQGSPQPRSTSPQNHFQQLGIVTRSSMVDFVRLHEFTPSPE